MSTVAGGGGSTLTGYVDGIGAVARFLNPWGISSLSSGDLVVTDNNNHIIRKITSSGTFTPIYIHTYIHPLLLLLLLLFCLVVVVVVIVVEVVVVVVVFIYIYIYFSSSASSSFPSSS